MKKGIVEIDWIGNVMGGDPVAVFYINTGDTKIPIESTQKYLAEIYIEEEVNYVLVNINGKIFAHLETELPH